MDWETGLAALDFTNYISVSRSLVSKFGLHAAVMIGELASEARYWSGKGELDDGWFYSTMENVENATGLSEHFQRQAVKCLVEAKLIEVAYKGLPRKRYFRVNGMMVIQAMGDEVSPDNRQQSTTCTTSDEPHEPLLVDHVDVNNNNEQLEITGIKKEGKTRGRGETYDSIVGGFTDDEALRRAIFDFIAMRKLIKKPMTNRALRMLLSKLSKLSGDPEEQVEILDQSILHNWQTVYALHDRGTASSGRARAGSNDSTRAGLEARGFYGNGAGGRAEDIYDC